MRKKLTTYIVTVMFVLLFALLVLHHVNTISVLPIAVQISAGDKTETVNLWESEEGIYYVFLPSYAVPEQVNIHLNTEVPVYCDGKLLYEGMTSDAFLAGKTYNLSFHKWGKEVSQPIIFLYSQNIATMYVDTQSGSMEYIHSKKGNKEAAEMRLYTADGMLDCEGTLDSIGGRGNYTWDNSEKKPYNILLSQETNMLNMGTGKKWVLLANAMDSTLMRNKIVYEFAKKIGLPYSPDSRWIDLYLNGEYQGVYQLSEPVEIGEDRVAISQTEGAILAVETEKLLEEKNDVYFVTDAGVAVEIRSPKPIGTDIYFELEGKLQSVENALLAKDDLNYTTGESWDKMIDIDSWLKKYLIDEVFGNVDTFVRSSYYYYNGDDSLLYAGPVWDYDSSMGSEIAWQLQVPQTFFANRLEAENGVNAPWFYSLYQNEIFYQKLVQMYQDVILPELEYLFNTTLSTYVEEIFQAAAMDKIRWNSDDLDLSACVDSLCNYMTQRIEFLNGIWVEEKSYYVVRATQQWGGYYAYYVVFTGNTLPILPVFEDTDSACFIGWIDEETGEPIDLQKPVTGDMKIRAQWTESQSNRTRRIVKLFPLATIAVIAVSLLAIEFKRWRKHK